MLVLQFFESIIFLSSLTSHFVLCWFPFSPVSLSTLFPGSSVHLVLSGTRQHCQWGRVLYL